jgi:hypothetical protein
VIIGVRVGVVVVFVADRCLWYTRVRETRNNYHTNIVVPVIDVVASHLQTELILHESNSMQ